MYQDVLKFWFEEIDESKWWTEDKDIVRLIFERFSEVHSLASRCELFEWRTSPESRLAEIIVLDQFSRNMFRNSPLAFSNDALALALSQEAISIGADNLLDMKRRSILIFPLCIASQEKFMMSLWGCIKPLVLNRVSILKSGTKK